VDCALLLADSEAICEDTFLVNSGEVAVRCVRGDELVALRHCEIRSKTGRLFDCGIEEDEHGTQPALPTCLFVSRCTTDDSSAQELGRYSGWTVSAYPSRANSTAELAMEADEYSPRDQSGRKRGRDDYW
jgi:hypothetical protein